MRRLQLAADRGHARRPSAKASTGYRGPLSRPKPRRADEPGHRARWEPSAPRYAGSLDGPRHGRYAPRAEGRSPCGEGRHDRRMSRPRTPSVPAPAVEATCAASGAGRLVHTRWPSCPGAGLLGTRYRAPRVDPAAARRGRRRRHSWSSLAKGAVSTGPQHRGATRPAPAPSPASPWSSPWSGSSRSCSPTAARAPAQADPQTRVGLRAVHRRDVPAGGPPDGPGRALLPDPA